MGREREGGKFFWASQFTVENSYSLGLINGFSLHGLIIAVAVGLTGAWYSYRFPE